MIYISSGCLISSIDQIRYVPFTSHLLNSKLIILSDPSFSFLKIWASMLLLLTYGLFSPLAAFGILVSILSRVFLLKGRICRYYHLEQRLERKDNSIESNNRSDMANSSSDINDSKRDKDDTDRNSGDSRICITKKDSIESFCANMHECIHAAIWPGLIVSTSLFSLYVLDMAYDTDEPHIAVPLTLMILTLLFIPFSPESQTRRF